MGVLVVEVVGEVDGGVEVEVGIGVSVATGALILVRAVLKADC